MFLRRYWLIKKRCVDRTPDMNRVKWVRQQLRTRMLWEFFLLYLPLLKVIPETESISSLSNSLQKISLEQLRKYGTFSEPQLFKRTFAFWKEIAFFYKSLLPFLTFVHCEGPYWGISSQLLFMFRSWVCAIRSHPKNKE